MHNFNLKTDAVLLTQTVLITSSNQFDLSLSYLELLIHCSLPVLPPMKTSPSWLPIISGCVSYEMLVNPDYYGPR